MSIESIIGVVSGVITIIPATYWLFVKFRKLPIDKLMNQLVDKSLSEKEHRNILKKINRRLLISDSRISDEYISAFYLNGRGKEAVFMDICHSNNIEPTVEICKKFTGSDMPSFRKKYYEKKSLAGNAENQGCQVVYMSELLKSKFPDCYQRLVSILDKHNVPYSLLKGTKDIWCRDYMPVQTESGTFVQFRYDPSYLKGKKEWEESRSDVKEVCRQNNIKAVFSDINLDGGNVLICKGRAIVSDRIFSENPEMEKETLLKELSRLLECEIIIIPSQKGDYTGHADGMVRFVDRSTIIGNKLDDEYKYWREGMLKVLVKFNIKYIDIPFVTGFKDAKHPNNALGIYVNYLMVNDLVVMPVYGIKEDKQAFDVLKQAFPNKVIETIDYSDVAKEGGVLNCTTWVVTN